ncbi:MC164L [Molluscum contagiosum virus]|uniref:MC164L n=1 Tax=Molluscum contagiosum virus TaxID=10279 RepID=A0A858A5I1_9POXV|nr:MC164L [Molluscum contagiosum virus]
MFFVRVRRDSRSQVPGRARLFGVAHARLLCLVRAGTMRRARTVVLCRVCGAPSTVWYRTVLLRVCGHQCWLLGTRCCFFACRHEQFFAGQPVVVPGHKTSRVRPSARVVVVQAQEVLGAGGAHRCFVLSRAQAAGTRCQGRAQVFCSFTRAGSRHQVPGARTGVLFFHARRQQAPGARGHEHGRVFVLLSRVQAAGPNTGVFCVFVFRAGSRTEHGRVLCFCFPLARACTWRRVLVSGHEPGCVLSRVQAPGTNPVVSFRACRHLARTRLCLCFGFCFLLRAQTPRHEHACFAPGHRVLFACAGTSRVVFCSRGYKHMCLFPRAFVCAYPTRTTRAQHVRCAPCVRTPGTGRQTTLRERECVCTRQRAAVVVCVRTHEHECCLVRGDERRAEHQEERTTRTAGRNNERERRAHSAPSVRSTVTPSPKSTASSPAAPAPPPLLCRSPRTGPRGPARPSPFPVPFQNKVRVPLGRPLPSIRRRKTTLWLVPRNRSPGPVPKAVTCRGSRPGKATGPPLGVSVRLR